MHLRDKPESPEVYRRRACRLAKQARLRYLGGDPMQKTSLSVLVPVYDEQHLVAESLNRLRVLEASDLLERVEVIVVDDCSKDETPEALRRFREALQRDGGSQIQWRFVRHEVNSGKGKAIQTALGLATCELSVIHDADLEYHPADLLWMVRVFLEEDADAVFGSRFAGAGARRVLLYRHQVGNKLLTFLTNLVTNLNFTDMETCYKAVRTALLKSIPIVSNDFRLEPELTIKLAKRQARIFEVPISYSGRTYQEGKKINWKDGVVALWAIARFAASDDIYERDEFGSQILGRLSRAPRFNEWMADVIRPFCGQRVLEIGSGVGNLTQRLIPRREYVVSDVNPLYLHTLASLKRDRPYLRVTYCDVTAAESFPKVDGGFDTVICLNVIEHVDDDRAALRNIRGVLGPGGRAIVLVPQGPGNFGTLDGVLGHKRRYTRETLAGLAESCGMKVAEMIPFNRTGSAAWFLNGKLLRRQKFGLGQILALNALTPLLRRVDALLPLPPLSLIAILEPSH
jgi:glycosyltransferase involved in cell wall biosynthesis/phospholipid N-methyltransferase